MNHRSIRYRDTWAAPGSQLHAALEDGDTKRAEEIYRQCEKEAAELIAKAHTAAVQMHAGLVIPPASARTGGVMVNEPPKCERCDRFMFSGIATRRLCTECEQDRKPATPCECRACLKDKTVDIGMGFPIPAEMTRMIVCAKCGNKRCPKANDHANICTNSNEPGQPGSAYQ